LHSHTDRIFISTDKEGSGERRVIGIDTELNGDRVSLSEPSTVFAGSYGWCIRQCDLTLLSSLAATGKCTIVYMYKCYFT
jgi:hypothetical protein